MMSNKNLYIICLLAFMLFHCFVNGQEVDQKLTIIDTTILKGNVLHVLEKSKVNDYQISSINIFIPDSDSVDFNNKRELKRYLKKRSHIFYIWPSQFLFLVKDTRPEYVDRFKYYKESELSDNIVEGIEFRYLNYRITCYSIVSEFIVATINYNLIEDYNNFKFIKFEEDLVKIIIPNIHTLPVREGFQPAPLI